LLELKWNPVPFTALFFIFPTISPKPKSLGDKVMVAVRHFQNFALHREPEHAPTTQEPMETKTGDMLDQHR
jgi:hypothetical protein